MRIPILVLALAMAACATVQDEAAEEAAATVRAVSMATPPISWQELGVHPALMQRACSVSTLVNAQGTVVGYCHGSGRSCRTNDWRPVMDGCVRRTTPATGVTHEVAVGR